MFIAEVNFYTVVVSYGPSHKMVGVWLAHSVDAISALPVVFCVFCRVLQV